ncbi:hypothetical protein SDC9_168988 [bioreactor metagenome]|uniref:Uncharacterized protein n=1 Tax=bioreactor metagenome TaxID=1076179 RepID=A0A645G420_9ZZZZ
MDGRFCPKRCLPINWPQPQRQRAKPLAKMWKTSRRPRPPSQPWWVARVRRCRASSARPRTARRFRPGRPRMPTPICTAPRTQSPPAWWATSTAPKPGSTTRHTTSCSTSAPCPSLCLKASPSPSFRPARTPTASRTWRASIRWPALAMASGPAITTWRSP